MLSSQGSTSGRRDEGVVGGSGMKRFRRSGGGGGGDGDGGPGGGGDVFDVV